MRLQDSQANCGPVAMRNALAAIGTERSTEECEKLCKTDATNGTRAVNLARAIQSVLGCATVISERQPDVALLRLEKMLRGGHATVLLVDAWDHYVAAVGMLGERFLIADSADNELVISLDPGKLLERWGNVGARYPYWAVVL